MLGMNAVGVGQAHLGPTTSNIESHPHACTRHGTKPFASRPEPWGGWLVDQRSRRKHSRLTVRPAWPRAIMHHARELIPHDGCSVVVDEADEVCGSQIERWSLASEVATVRSSPSKGKAFTELGKPSHTRSSPRYRLSTDTEPIIQGRASWRVTFDRRLIIYVYIQI